MDNALNKITANAYPDWYEQEQIDEYLECIALGRAHIGSKITKHDEYLIDMASKMAINGKYKRGINLTIEQLDKLKAIHKETLDTQVHTTPPDGWYTTELNPLNNPYEPEILPHNNEEILTNKDIE